MLLQTLPQLSSTCMHQLAQSGTRVPICITGDTGTAAWQDITPSEQLVRAGYFVKAAWGDAGLFRLFQVLSGGPDPSLSENIEAPAAVQVRERLGWG